MVVAAHEDARVPGEHDERDVARLECRLQLFAVLDRRGRNRAARRRPAPCRQRQAPPTPSRTARRSRRRPPQDDRSNRVASSGSSSTTITLQPCNSAALAVAGIAYTPHALRIRYANGTVCNIVPAQSDEAAWPRPAAEVLRCSKTVSPRGYHRGTGPIGGRFDCNDFSLTFAAECAPS